MYLSLKFSLLFCAEPTSNGDIGNVLRSNHEMTRMSSSQAIGRWDTDGSLKLGAGAQTGAPNRGGQPLNVFIIEILASVLCWAELER